LTEVERRGFTGECDWIVKIAPKTYEEGDPMVPRSRRPGRVPPSRSETRPLEIKAGDLRVSAFSRRGSGCHTLGPPGGHIYESASSRHSRHREVYRSSASGRAVADNAVPLGGGGGHRGAGGGPREGVGKEKAAPKDDASAGGTAARDRGELTRIGEGSASNGPRVEKAKSDARAPRMYGRGPLATRVNPSNSNAALIRPGQVSSPPTIDTVKVLQEALLRESVRPVEDSRTVRIVALLKKLDNADVSVDILSRNRVGRSLKKIRKYDNVTVRHAVSDLMEKWSAICG
jgi:hypothetical protein